MPDENPIVPALVCAEVPQEMIDPDNFSSGSNVIPKSGAGRGLVTFRMDRRYTR